MSDATHSPGLYGGEAAHLPLDSTSTPSSPGLPELPRPWVPSAIIRAFDRASGSARESDWERFVDHVWRVRETIHPAELEWLLETCGRVVAVRPREALLRAVFMVAEAGHAPLQKVERLFVDALREPLAELRLLALEALLELVPSRVNRLAFLAEDPHSAVRRLFASATGAAVAE